MSPRVHEQQLNVRVSTEAFRLLKELQTKCGESQRAVIELLIRERAQAEGVVLPAAVQPVEPTLDNLLIQRRVQPSQDSGTCVLTREVSPGLDEED